MNASSMLRIAWNSSGVPAQEEFSFDLLSHLQRIEARPRELEGEFEMAMDNGQEPEFACFFAYKREIATAK